MTSFRQKESQSLGEAAADFGDFHNLCASLQSISYSLVPFSRVLAMGTVPARFLIGGAARCDWSPLRPLELGNVLTEDVAGAQGRNQVVELALVVGVAVRAVRLIFLVQRDTVENSFARIFPLHRTLLQL